MLGQLCRDKIFCLAIAVGPLFWGISRVFELSTTATAFDLQSLLLLSFLYPVLEELAFRGALQSSLLKSEFGSVRRLGLTQANWLCSCIFVVFHLWSQSPVWAAAVFFPSLVFGFFRDRYNSTVPAIVLHCFYNFGFFLSR